MQARCSRVHKAAAPRWLLACCGSLPPSPQGLQKVSSCNARQHACCKPGQRARQLLGVSKFGLLMYGPLAGCSNSAVAGRCPNTQGHSTQVLQARLVSRGPAASSSCATASTSCPLAWPPSTCACCFPLMTNQLECLSCRGPAVYFSHSLQLRDCQHHLPLGMASLHVCMRLCHTFQRQHAVDQWFQLALRHQLRHLRVYGGVLMQTSVCACASATRSS